MLEERAYARATIDLDEALSCFEVDLHGAMKKIRYVSFYSLSTTSTYDVKINETSIRFGIAHDEWAKITNDNAEHVQNQMLDNINKLIADREKK